MYQKINLYFQLTTISKFLMSSSKTYNTLQDCISIFNSSWDFCLISNTFSCWMKASCAVENFCESCIIMSDFIFSSDMVLPVTGKWSLSFDTCCCELLLSILNIVSSSKWYKNLTICYKLKNERDIKTTKSEWSLCRGFQVTERMKSKFDQFWNCIILCSCYWYHCLVLFIQLDSLL